MKLPSKPVRGSNENKDSEYFVIRYLYLFILIIFFIGFVTFLTWFFAVFFELRGIKRSVELIITPSWSFLGFLIILDGVFSFLIVLIMDLVKKNNF
ncbi:MAG: hypothetical protein BTN85_1363 [Candidatus Methanohalarchaeum thermophilum]|uniref:Uncharacterized protein n=1 Tax=Methanohalarchaeum thermophilum TaxID=1903181 RepID=A0A1Q6DWX9_METT1|nr:MAG: hypothetical protein BTN85_1363 [Candidatus Methanohalarchaeum thermophilum]